MINIETLRRLPPGPPRMDDASCVDQADLFFPAHGDRAAIRQARLICSVCPAFATCMAYVVRAWPPYGVWAGMSETQRRKLRREMRKQQAT